MQNQVVKQALDDMLGKVQDFTLDELHSINKKLFGDILISPGHNKIGCGRYVATKKNNDYWVVKNQLGDIKGHFSLKLTAVHFMIALMKEKFKLSDGIKSADENLIKSQILYDTLYTRLAQCKVTDQFALNLYCIKFACATEQLDAARNILHTIIEKAKYLNLIGKH
jgi:hypothetical protein